MGQILDAPHQRQLLPQLMEMLAIGFDQICLNRSMEGGLFTGVGFAGFEDLFGATAAEHVTNQDASFTVDKGIEG